MNDDRREDLANIMIRKEYLLQGGECDENASTTWGWRGVLLHHSATTPYTPSMYLFLWHFSMYGVEGWSKNNLQQQTTYRIKKPQKTKVPKKFQLTMGAYYTPPPQKCPPARARAVDPTPENRLRQKVEQES